MHIRTSFVFPPIPDRNSDWAATTDDYEPGHPIGEGRTELAAVKDLISQLEDDERATREELDAAFTEWWQSHSREAKERHDHFHDEYNFERNYTAE